MNVIEPYPPALKRIKIDLPGGRRVKLIQLTFDDSGNYDTSEIELTLKGEDTPVNTTKIFEPDEQDDHHFQMATWYGPQSTAHDDVPDTEKLEVQGGENYFIVTSDGQSMEFDQEDLAGLKLMLNEYENWLEEH